MMIASDQERQELRVKNAEARNQLIGVALELSRMRQILSRVPTNDPIAFAESLPARLVYNDMVEDYKEQKAKYDRTKDQGNPYYSSIDGTKQPTSLGAVPIVAIGVLIVILTGIIAATVVLYKQANTNRIKVEKWAEAQDWYIAHDIPPTTTPPDTGFTMPDWNKVMVYGAAALGIYLIMETVKR